MGTDRSAFWIARVSLAVALLSAVFTGLTVIFTGLQWRVAQNQLLFSLRPHVDFDTEDAPDNPPFGIAVANEGPGPAIVKSVRYFVDRKQMRDVDEAVSIGKVAADQVDYFEYDPDDVMAVGEKKWLIQWRPRRGKPSKPGDPDHFADFIDDHLGIAVTFCSSADENACWTTCSTKDRCQQTGQ